ncbi:hypothetical protein BB560_005346, partial [Smittium megazygosporum]
MEKSLKSEHSIQKFNLEFEKDGSKNTKESVSSYGAVDITEANLLSKSRLVSIRSLICGIFVLSLFFYFNIFSLKSLLDYISIFPSRIQFSKDNRNLYMRQVYVQERPTKEFLTDYFNKLDSQLRILKNPASLKELVGVKDFYRLKRRTIDYSNLREVASVMMQTPMHQFGKSSKSFYSYNNKISLVKRTNSLSKSLKGDRKYNRLKIHNAGPSNDPKSNKFKKTLELGTSFELLKLGSEFRNSNLGVNRSFWEPSSTDSDSASAEFYKDYLAVDDYETAFAMDDYSGEWKYNIKDGLLIPNVTDKDTLVNIAYMAANSYRALDDITWEYLGKSWRNDSSIGWDSDGLRGYVFSTMNNDTVVISFKGTSASLFMVGGGPTSAKDKLNDNRLFSCCCARVDYSWRTVCGCYKGGNKCDISCLQDSLQLDDVYFHAAAKVIMDVSQMYPNAYIVLTGHSLGGSIAALMGLTFGLPVVSFQAPGDMLAAKRLHLPMPPAMDLSKLPVHHFGHNSDPIYLGTCVGSSSSCYYGGYAMESKCHVGHECVFDTESLLGWKQDIRHHRMFEVIDYVLKPWVSDIENSEMPKSFTNLKFFEKAYEQYEKEQADNSFSKPAIIDETGSYTYSDLIFDSTKVKKALENLNLERRHIALYIPNCYAYSPATLGTWLYSGATVPLSMMHVEHELEYFVSAAECSCIITTSKYEDFVAKFINKYGLDVKILNIEKVLETKLEKSEIEYSEVSLDSTGLIIYTSGTTGKPKGVLLTQRNLNAQINALYEAWLFTSNDKLLHVLPLHHMHGIVVALFTTLYAGATVEIMPSFSVSKTYDRILNGKPDLTLLMAVPAIYNLLLLKYSSFNEEEKKLVYEKFQHFRLTICGSAPLLESTFKKWYDATGHYMLERYGMSEIGMALSNDASDPSKRGCVGNPLPGVSVRIFSDDSKVITEYETPGEVQIKGDTVFVEFKTGDIGVLDKRGVYRLLGRNSTDIIKSGGYKLSSIEIERTLLGNEEIEDVSVVALSDDILGEIPAAAIVLKDKNAASESKKQEIEKWGLEQMARYKAPKKYVFIEELPRNLMKKVNKQM